MIDPKRVEAIFMDCLFKEGEDTSVHIVVEGIRGKYGLHPERIKEHEIEIAEMLAQLPDSFKESGGGGMSFLNACEDKDGNQWTGLHERMEQLFCLGIASGKAKCLVPRRMWSIFPGGMPYYSVAV